MADWDGVTVFSARVGRVALVSHGLASTIPAERGMRTRKHGQLGRSTLRACQTT